MHIINHPLLLLPLRQVYVLGDLLGGDDDQDSGQGLHPEQVHIPTQPVELAGLRGDCVRLRHHRHRAGRYGRPAGESRGTSDLPCPEGAQDGVYHAW